jgi:tetratricopeptide (TPR) repeat protein
MRRHFISYSEDGFDFARQLASRLQASDPPILVWFNRDELEPGSRWPGQLEQALGQCSSLILVVTRGSIRGESVCTNEWLTALNRKLPIIPLLIEPGIEPPALLNDRQHIDFTRLEYAAAFDRLRVFLWSFDDRGKARPGREAKAPEGQPTATRSPKFIHGIPPADPDYFQDRRQHLDAIWHFLTRASMRLCVVLGREGIGKTAIVSRSLRGALDSLAAKDPPKIHLDGILYLDVREGPPLTARSLLVDLVGLLDDDRARSLDPLLGNPHIGIGPKVDAVVEALRGVSALLVIDGFDGLLDATREIADADLGLTLRALVSRDKLGLKVLLSSTRLPGSLLAIAAVGRWKLVDVAKGLDASDGVRVLQALEVDVDARLQGLPEEMLQALSDHVSGHPRALAVLHAYMATNPWATPQKILSASSAALPEQVMEELVGRTFASLDILSQQTMQALAVYGRPVEPEAVDHLLRPYVGTVATEPTLQMLLRLHLIGASEDGARFFLPHGSELEYIQHQIPATNDERSDTEVSFSMPELLHRAADYFARFRNPDREPQDLDDLAPQLAEIDLRRRAENYPLAAWLLLRIANRYLLSWGEHRLVFQLHESLAGTLDDRPDLEQRRLGMMGNASLGFQEAEEAIEYYRQALEITHDIGDRLHQKRWLSNIGSCYYKLGRLQQAVDYYERAHDLARELGELKDEVAPLTNIAICHWDRGRLALAQDMHEQALTIARQVGVRDSEAQQLVNIGAMHAQLGEWDRAMERLDEGLALAREIGRTKVIGDALGELALLRMDQGRLDEAVVLAEQAVEATSRHGTPELGRDANHVLALACLATGAVSRAHRSIELACHLSTRARSYDVFALRGVIALRLGRLDEADDALGFAMGRADTALEDSHDNLAALDARGLALSGLVLQGDHERAGEAIDAYREARRISQAPGIVDRVLRLLDSLAVIDLDGRLVPIRAAAAGTARSAARPERQTGTGV